eukprot:3587923-Rhodomonas_salina.1
MQHFHNPDGSGYKWLAERIVDIDKINPQMPIMCTRSCGSKYPADLLRNCVEVQPSCCRSVAEGRENHVGHRCQRG